MIAGPGSLGKQESSRPLWRKITSPKSSVEAEGNQLVRDGDATYQEVSTTAFLQLREQDKLSPEINFFQGFYSTWLTG